MKLLIAGTRRQTHVSEIEKLIDDLAFFDSDAAPLSQRTLEIVSGGAFGVDKAAEQWANQRMIKTKIFLPDYEKHGAKAPLLRNIEMAKYAAAALILWDGESKGTRHMIEQMKKQGKPCLIKIT